MRSHAQNHAGCDRVPDPRPGGPRWTGGHGREGGESVDEAAEDVKEGVEETADKIEG